MIKKRINVYPSENEIKKFLCGYLENRNPISLGLYCQKQLRPMEKHPYLFPIDAGRSSSYWLVFNVVHLISLSTLWFMTANRESVKPAFWWVGNRLEYLDSFHVHSQPVLLDIKKTSENSPDLLQTQSEIQGDDSSHIEGTCHEYIIEAYTSNLRGKSRSCVNKNMHTDPK